MSDDIHPPKPALAIRIGVTGHRQARLAREHTPRIVEQVQLVLNAVASGMAAARKSYQADYAATDPICYFVSALADGADTLAAQRAIESGWRLLAPLPFQKSSYQRDFSPEGSEQFDRLLNKADAIAELDGSRDGPAHQDRAYLQAGVVTVDQSDIVIAVWDGEEARGVGGTAMITEQALAAGKPVIWINATTDKPLVFLNAENKQTPFSEEAILAIIDAIVAPPPRDESEHAYSGKKTHARTAYHAFAEETVHGFNYGSFFEFWEKAFAGKWPFKVGLTTQLPADEIAKAQQATLAEKMQATSRDQKVFNELIIPRFVWADHLAIHYGNLYRSSYFFNYLFAAAAVFLALFDLVAGGFGIGSKTIWIGIEVTLIILILVVTTRGKRGRWHEKWIDYRQLAEELRQYRLYFLTLGRATGGDSFAQGEGAESASWIEWYLAATRRESGMTSASFGADEVRLIAETILKEELEPQIAYHDRKAGTLLRMEHRLHHLGEMAFALTLLVCLFYLSLVFLKAGDGGAVQHFAYKAEKLAKGWVTMMTGFLPALGAAFFGIRVQGEFGSTAERSHATATQLKAIVTRFEALSKAETPRLEVLRTRVAEAARAMLMENMDWRLLYISKPLNLPG